MNFFAQTPSVEARALAMPQMRPLLERMARNDAALRKWVSASSLFRAKGGRPEADLIAAAEVAGFIETDSRGQTSYLAIAITDKGRAVIGAPVPIWRVAA